MIERRREPVISSRDCGLCAGDLAQISEETLEGVAVLTRSDVETAKFGVASAYATLKTHLSSSKILFDFFDSPLTNLYEWTITLLKMVVERGACAQLLKNDFVNKICVGLDNLQARVDKKSPSFLKGNDKILKPELQTKIIGAFLSWKTALKIVFDQITTKTKILAVVDFEKPSADTFQPPVGYDSDLFPGAKNITIP